MRFVDRLRTSRHVRTIRAGDSASPEALAEAKDGLVTAGGAAISPMLECLSSPGRAAALEVLTRVLDDGTLSEFVAALASADRHISSGVRDVLCRGHHYDAHTLISYLAADDIPNARLEPVLQARAQDLDPARLIELLPDLARESRQVVYQLVEKRAEPGLRGAAIRLLSHEDWWLRAHMAQLLERIGGEEAESALAAALGDANRNVRLQAVKSLQALRSASSVPFLANALRDGDLTVQAAAIDALITINDPSSVRHLVDVLKDESEQCRRGAVEVLNEVATPEAIQDLVHALRDADWWVRVRSADALGTIGGPKVVDAILGLMKDEDVHIRRYAVEILNTVPDGRSVGPLLTALRDDDWWVRERSIDALGRAGDRQATAPLLTMLERDPEVAPLVVKALRQLGDPAAIGGLLGALDRNPSDELHDEIVQTLKDLDNQADVAPVDKERIEAALKHEGVRVEKTRLRPMAVKAAHLSTERAAPPAAPTSSRRPRSDSGARSSSRDSGAMRPPSPAPAPRRAPRADEIRPGDVLLERYRVVKPIGSGGFSTVFLVEDVVVEETMILKVLSHALTLDENSLARFVRELKLSRKIAHPNVIRIHDLLEFGETRAISMEYFPGKDLGRVLDVCEKLSEARAVPIAQQIASGLSAAHSEGIIHRDVKPANVLVGENDQVRIVDFGLASVIREAENRLTRTGHLVGTPHYMAPELIRGEEVDGRADLYSLGVMMYEMLSGKLPYDGDNPMHVLFRHLDGDAPPLAEVAGVSDGLSAIVARLMATDPGERYARAADLSTALASLAG